MLQKTYITLLFLLVASCAFAQKTERDYLRSYLTETEYEIILLYIFYGYTIAEIARGKGLSRQAVNQQKRSAMEKLRNAAQDI